MREDTRLEALQNDADWLLRLPDTLLPADKGRIANIAQNMKKTAAFILDRDAAPTIDLRSELTLKNTQLETYQRVGAETVARLDKAINAGALLLTQNNNLREALKSDLGKAELKAKAEKLVEASQSNVAEAAGVVTDLNEIEKVKE